jgi:hypothetical protein
MGTAPEALWWAKTVSGPFIGAGLAFLATKVHDRSKSKQENLAAARLAIVTLGEQLTDVLLFRKALYQRLEQQGAQLSIHAPRWLFIYPMQYIFLKSATVEMKSLAFLYETVECGDLYEKVSLAGRSHAHLQAVADELRDTALKVQNQLAAVTGSKPEESINKIREAVGPALAYKASDLLTAALDASSENAVNQFLSAADYLRNAVLKRYPNAKAIPQLEVPEPFRLDALPAVPQVFINPQGMRY